MSKLLKYSFNVEHTFCYVCLNLPKFSEIRAWWSDVAPDADVTDCCEQARKSETNSVEQNLEKLLSVQDS